MRRLRGGDGFHEGSGSSWGSRVSSLKRVREAPINDPRCRGETQVRELRHCYLRDELSRRFGLNPESQAGACVDHRCRVDEADHAEKEGYGADKNCSYGKPSRQLPSRFIDDLYGGVPAQQGYQKNGQG